MMDRFNEISTLMGDPPADADFDALMAEMGELQEKIDAVDGWTLDNQLEIAMDALRCPPGDCVGRKSVGRREAPRRADPAAAREAQHPAARRADQPPRRRERPVARKASRWTIPATSSSSPTTATSSTMWSTGSSNSIAENTSSTRAIIRPTSTRRPSGSSRKSREDEGRQKAISDELEWIRQIAQGAPDQVQGAHQGVRPAGRGAGEARPRQGADRHPDPRAPGRQRHRGDRA